MDLDQVKCMKDEERKILVQDKDMKDKWKNYFHKLFNEGNKILPEDENYSIMSRYHSIQ